ncbi:MAG TPA: site-2 protease family protein [Pirellulales bacterium]|nr:site-2 protease family protein [Pirellulales bacterium]
MPDDLVSTRPQVAISCPQCGIEIAPSLLCCPSCRWLVHGARLKELVASAEDAERAGDLAGALNLWRDASALLPQETRQYSIIAGHIARLGRMVEAQPPGKGAPSFTAAGKSGAAPQSRWSGGAISGVIGTVALAAWKFKVIGLAALTKGKILLLGLTKASTFVSMFAFMGVYWAEFGGWLALGLVLSIYVHEMGHVFSLLRYGVRASAPLFIPGLGAVVRLNQALVDPKQDARVGLAGPIWGTAAALVCAGVYALTARPIWAAIAQLGAIINLFNLMPFWQLDGARAFRSLNRSQRWLAVATTATAWALTDQWLLVLLIAVGAWHTISDKPSDKPDAPIVAQYAILVMILSALSQLPVPMGRS